MMGKLRAQTFKMQPALRLGSIMSSSKLQLLKLLPHDCNRLRASVSSSQTLCAPITGLVPPYISKPAYNLSPEDGLDSTPYLKTCIRFISRRWFGFHLITSIPSCSLARIGYSTEPPPQSKEWISRPMNGCHDRGILLVLCIGRGIDVPVDVLPHTRPED
ncbi:hypothetical protein RHMOL_Rhmol01G0152900 [Rhododendron molle]|uniref:Uncharacterized protein n=1 Tax=Rhododendron molle TaxID=49168 RepID=A0ACC0Q348_RHOML|nr:hypothetical protein RHMOL_Rhmol01G0152900 [Rhododendron molle]